MRAKLTLSAVVFAALCACGEQRSTGNGMPLNLYVSGAFANRLSGLQISVVKGANTLDREALAKGCLKDQVAPTQFVLQDDGAGKKTKARLFPIADGASTFDFELTGIEAGSQYLFVVEALSKDVPPQLLASDNQAVTKFDPGDNAPLKDFILSPFASPDAGVTDGGVVTKPCDPRIN